jgi:hypothetical protein
MNLVTVHNLDSNLTECNKGHETVNYASKGTSYHLKQWLETCYHV